MMFMLAVLIVTSYPVTPEITVVAGAVVAVSIIVSAFVPRRSDGASQA
ncbi:hypothetical protein [Cryobacterium sp. TMT4-31]|nr:hypothetical protein [Cryobacterium sp. TMT4-31]